MRHDYKSSDTSSWGMSCLLPPFVPIFIPLASGCSIPSFWKGERKLMAIYTGYFDESGDENEESFLLGPSAFIHPMAFRLASVIALIVPDRTSQSLGTLRSLSRPGSRRQRPRVQNGNSR
jgi:hypothetical protein